MSNGLRNTKALLLTRTLILRFCTQRWLPIIGLLSLALGGVIFLNHTQELVNGRSITQNRNPDFYLKDFVQTAMDPSGQRKHRLSGKRLMHFHDTDTHELIDPFLQIFHQNHSLWHVKSERGWISSTGEEIILTGNVNAWRNDEAGVKEIDAHTSELRILTSLDYAETDKPVVIRNLHGQSNGIGMRTFMKEESIELLGRVKTVHHLTPKPTLGNQ